MAANAGRRVWFAGDGVRLAIRHASKAMEAARPKCGRRFRFTFTRRTVGPEECFGLSRRRIHTANTESSRLHVPLESADCEQGLASSSSEWTNSQSFSLRRTRGQPVVSQTPAVVRTLLSRGALLNQYFSLPCSLLSCHFSFADNVLRDCFSRACVAQ